MFRAPRGSTGRGSEPQAEARGLARRGSPNPNPARECGGPIEMTDDAPRRVTIWGLRRIVGRDVPTGRWNESPFSFPSGGNPFPHARELGSRAVSRGCVRSLAGTRIRSRSRTAGILSRTPANSACARSDNDAFGHCRLESHPPERVDAPKAEAAMRGQVPDGILVPAVDDAPRRVTIRGLRRIVGWAVPTGRVRSRSGE